MMKFNSVFSLLSMILMMISFLLLSMFCLVLNSSYELSLDVELISLASYKLSFLVLFDYMSVFFFSTVCLIASSIFFFSSSYMSPDKTSNRFLGMVLLFIASMSLLIFSPNLISLLLGWDGLGVTSYLLVCYYSSEKSFNASMLTALSNRLGDVIILLLIAFNITPSVINYGMTCYCDFNLMSGVFMVLLAAMTKSAQVPFSAWLPAAMAAPTPVSALVHSSTLVTAGVYLMIRFNFMMSGHVMSILITWVGCMTMILAGGAALLELDMKKIIALSTLSQLGMMVFTIGLGEIFLSWMHLISHAYFKAMMFMGAGAMIHSVSGYQDTRKMGSMNKNNFFISSMFLSGSLSLCGLPFLSGFYSKDAILEQFFMGSFNTWTCVMVFTATMFTAAYSFRVLSMIFIFFSSREGLSSEMDSNSRMSAGMFMLFFPACVGGLLLSSWNQSPILVEIPLWMKLAVLIGLVFTVMILKSLNLNLTPESLLSSGVHQMWFFPLIVSPIFSEFFLKKSKTMLKIQELSWSLWLVGGWAAAEKGGVNFSSLLNTKFMNALFVMIFLAMFH